jgi:integrase
MSVKKLPSGRYYFAIRVRVSGGQVRQVKRSGFEHKYEAVAALAEYRRQLGLGVDPAAPKQTVGEYLDRWLDGCEDLRATTKALRRGHIEAHLRPVIGGVWLHELHPEHVRAVVRQARSRLSVGTLHTVFATLRSALNDAVRDGLIPANPCARVRMPKVPRRRYTVWTPEQTRRFFEAIRDDRLYAAWWLAANTGLRRGELCALRWTDLDLDGLRVTVTRQRVHLSGRVEETEVKTTESDGVVALDPGTVDALRHHKRRQAEEHMARRDEYEDRGYVFANELGAPYAPKTLATRFVRLVRQADVPAIRLHDLRHLHATVGLLAGVPLKVMQARLRHANPNTTLAIYSHVLREMDEDAATTIAARLAR